MGRWAYFNTGVSYKFAHGQSSYDITELFSDYDEIPMKINQERLWFLGIQT